MADAELERRTGAWTEQVRCWARRHVLPGRALNAGVQCAVNGDDIMPSPLKPLLGSGDGAVPAELLLCTKIVTKHWHWRLRCHWECSPGASGRTGPHMHDLSISPLWEELQTVNAQTDTRLPHPNRHAPTRRMAGCASWWQSWASRAGLQSRSAWGAAAAGRAAACGERWSADPWC
jgi:hypothetical protein